MNLLGLPAPQAKPLNLRHSFRAHPTCWWWSPQPHWAPGFQHGSSFLPLDLCTCSPLCLPCLSFPPGTYGPLRLQDQFCLAAPGCATSPAGGTQQDWMAHKGPLTQPDLICKPKQPFPSPTPGFLSNRPFSSSESLVGDRAAHHSSSTAYSWLPIGSCFNPNPADFSYLKRSPLLCLPRPDHPSCYPVRHRSFCMQLAPLQTVGAQ